ncbi:thiol-activated cytolysin family protein [Cellulophaga lytica]|nr:thiol-activated cytolysin family protein [Cellulophaga lytica]
MKHMHSYRLKTNLLMFLILFASVLSCNKEDEAQQTDNELKESDFNSVLAIGKDLEEPVQQQIEVSSTQSEQAITSNDDEGNPIVENWKCTTTTYDLKRESGGEDGFPLFSPNAKIIYPGSLLQGKTLKNTTPDVIAVDRAGGTVSYDLVNGNISSNVTVDVVSKSSIQDAMNQIIAASPDVTPANFTFEYEQVQSREALAISMGLDIKSAFVKAGASFDFKNGDNKNRILVKLKQTFYTMSMNLPTSMDDLFTDTVTPEDLAKYVQEDNPATYISDVTYGRVYYMLIETSSSYQELNVAANASFGVFSTKVKAELEVNHLKELKNVNIKVIAFGGDTESTISTIGETNLSSLVSLLSKSANIGSGLPISYVVRSVNTNQIVGVQLATNYNETNCEPLFDNGEPIQTKHWRGYILNKMGGVGAAFERNKGEFILINTSGDKYMRSFNGALEGPFSVSDLFAGEYPFFIGDKDSGKFDGIGAIVNLRKTKEYSTINKERQFLAISKSGLQFKYVSSNSWENFTSLEDLSIENLGRAGSSEGFGTEGIGALLYNDYILSNEEEDLYESLTIAFDKSGKRIMYFITGDGNTDIVMPLNLYTIKNSNNILIKNIPLETVGASFNFYVGDKLRSVVFDITGTKYAVSGDDIGNYSPIFTL